MRSEKSRATLRCAVYTRVSTEHGLEQEFNSLDNQREASEAYVKSQAHEGWKLIRNRGYLLPDFCSGATGISGRFSEGILRRSHA